MNVAQQESFDEAAKRAELDLRVTLRPLSAESVVRAVAHVSRRDPPTSGPPPRRPPFLCLLAHAACGYCDGTLSVGEEQLAGLQDLAQRCDEVAGLASLEDERPLAALLLSLSRSQFLAQGGISSPVFARSLAMFGREVVPPSVAAAFERREGVPLEDALCMFFALYSLSHTRNEAIAVPDVFGWFAELGVEERHTSAFIDSASWTIDALGAAYRRSRSWDDDDALAQRNAVPASERPHRDRVPPRMWMHQRLGLLVKPLVQAGSHLVAPMAALCERFACDLPWRSAKAEGGADERDGIGAAFEAYVGGVLAELGAGVRLSDARTLRAAMPPGSKSCDFMVEEPAYTLLVECKSIKWDTRARTLRALIGSTFLDEVADGLGQLSVVARSLRAGQLRPDARLELVAPVVAVLEEVPALGDQHVRAAIESRARKRGHNLDALGPPIAPWQVIDIGSIEDIVRTCVADRITPLDLVREYCLHAHVNVGDWPQFLHNRRPGMLGGLQLWQTAVQRRTHVPEALRRWLVRSGQRTELEHR